ncbi:MAG: glycosyltransferase family 4 protein [Bryobacteraceae bacterium]|nr:glycosyltransferase family 4 protein [Bryobacteraceae bacterium]
MTVVGVQEAWQAETAPDFKPVRELRIGYLVSRFPSVSHTFIFREVTGLRALGIHIATASVNEPDRAVGQMPADEASASGETFYLKREGARGVFRSLSTALFHQPQRLLKGLLLAFQLAGPQPRRLTYHFFYYLEAVMLADWVRRERLEHLHVHFATQAATVAMIASEAFGIPFSISVHGPDEFDNVSAFSLPEKIQSARFLCCIGDFCRSQLMKQASPSEWHKFHKAPLGVDLAEFRPAPAARRNAIPTMVCVGRLVPAKGQHSLLEAASQLASAGRNFRLVLVGDGPDRESLRNTVERLGLAGNVVFTGALNRDRIREQLLDADVFALASFSEGIPVALMEAMAMGIPCCSTFVAGIPELIRNGIDGILVPPADTKALASALGLLLGDPNLRDRMGASARSRIAAEYNLEVNIPRLAAIFRNNLTRAVEC